MTDLDHAQIVLAAIIPERRDLLDKALRHLTEGHFLDPVLKNTFLFLERYAAVTGAILSRQALLDQLAKARVDAGKAAVYAETYDLLYINNVSDADFRWSLNQLREQVATRETDLALREATTILTKGIELPDGNELTGHSDARSHLLTKFAEIDRELSMQDTPEGDVRAEVNEILEDYSERKRLHSLGRGEGILFGIPALDAKVGGLQNGEMSLIIGASGSGKTSSVTQLAWHASTQQGKNVVIATTETLRDQIRRKLIARHSKLSKFGLSEGLNTRDLKAGTLTESQEIKLREVAEDFGNNPAHGVCYVMQVPRGATIAMVESRFHRLQATFNIDLGIIDYFALLKSDRRRNSVREELTDILKAGKQFATSFDDGRGIPLVSPWQVSRAAQAEAESVGHYTLSALAETSEATNSSDVVVSVFALDTTSRYGDVRAQVLKNRDGETSDAVPLQVDYATSCFTERGTTTIVQQEDNLDRYDSLFS